MENIKEEKLEMIQHRENFLIGEYWLKLYVNKKKQQCIEFQRNTSFSKIHKRIIGKELAHELDNMDWENGYIVQDISAILNDLI